MYVKVYRSLLLVEKKFNAELEKNCSEEEA